jgi:hypothetical protein
MWLLMIRERVSGEISHCAASKLSLSILFKWFRFLTIIVSPVVSAVEDEEGLTLKNIYVKKT